MTETSHRQEVGHRGHRSLHIDLSVSCEEREGVSSEYGISEQPWGG